VRLPYAISEFREPDFHRMRGLMRRATVIDGRNLLDPTRMARAGFVHRSVGRQEVQPPTFASVVPAA
jgi:UDPglucose 6-dehydrogenase